MANALGMGADVTVTVRQVFNTELNGPLVTFRCDAWVPHWLLVVAALALPTLRLSLVVFRRRRSGRAASQGLCARCGYDLRATPDKCPECGAEAAASTAS